VRPCGLAGPAASIFRADNRQLSFLRIVMPIYQTKRRYIPDDNNIDIYWADNFTGHNKSRKLCQRGSTITYICMIKFYRYVLPAYNILFENQFFCENFWLPFFYTSSKIRTISMSVVLTLYRKFWWIIY
jgi:hypothetical protein